MSPARALSRFAISILKPRPFLGRRIQSIITVGYEGHKLKFVSKIRRRRRGVQCDERSRILVVLIGGVGMLGDADSYGQPGDSLAGETAAQALKRSIADEEYNLKWGPVRFQTEAGLGLAYTDNVFYSDKNRSEDLLVNPQIDLKASWPITELNTLRLSLGLGYEWYLNNTQLNSDGPLINPDSELVFNVFVGDFRIRLREKFSYEESLFYNSSAASERFFNFSDVGKFARWNNLAGLEVVWDLNKVILSAGYDHENFAAVTTEFEYLDRASELFTASVAFRLGDKVQTGLEGQASLHDYDQETTLNDNLRARGGPFIELTTEEKISLRAGGGFETAQFDPGATDNNDFEDYYAYASLRQETRLFSHALTAGREHQLGDNANNLSLSRALYSISSPIIKHVALRANLSVNFAEEFGGAYKEEFTYYRAGVGFSYQFHKHWRTGLDYDFFVKDSDLPFRDFYRNRVTGEVAFTF